jgi:hypothetical protein
MYSYAQQGVVWPIGLDIGQVGKEWGVLKQNSLSNFKPCDLPKDGLEMKQEVRPEIVNVTFIVDCKIFQGTAEILLKFKKTTFCWIFENILQRLQTSPRAGG